MSGDPAPVVVVSLDLCVPYPVDLTVVRKASFIGRGKYEVKDVNGNLMFRAEETIFSLWRKLVFTDASRTPIITLRRKVSAHSRWRAFRGDGTDEKDKLFDIKRSALFQLNTELHVFLTNNKSNEEVPDYRVNGVWNGKSCEIYSGNSSILLAKMVKKSYFFGDDKLLVTTNPKVDSAFIVSLIVILDDTKQEKARAVRAARSVVGDPTSLFL